MPLDQSALRSFLAGVHPYDTLEATDLDHLLPTFRLQHMAAGQDIYTLGEALEGLYLIHSGRVEVRDQNGAVISQLGPRNSFGERGLTRDGLAATSARTLDDTMLLVLPKAQFLRLVETQPAAARFFDRQRPARPKRADLATSRVETLMASAPLTCPPETSLEDVIGMMRRHRRAEVLVVEASGRLLGVIDIYGALAARDSSAAGPMPDAVKRVRGGDL
jgi:CBS domain-containing protein